MKFRKPSIVNQSFGVQDHINNGVDGIIVDGSPEGYVRALNWVLDPKNAAAVKHLCEAGHRTASERFSLKRHLQQVVDLMLELASPQKRARATEDALLTPVTRTWPG